MPDHIMVSEIFGPTIQGEGALAGQLSHFLRTFGCSYRCNWCDSMHAVDPNQSSKAHRLTAGEIVERVHWLKAPAPWLTITGGDPVDWDLTGVVVPLSAEYRIAVETQGARWQEWLEYCHLITVSPKGPSSGMVDRLDPAILQKYHARLRARMVLKLVCFDDADLDFAERIRRFLPDIQMYLSAGTEVNAKHPAAAVTQQYKWLAEAVIERPKLVNCVILPQLHVLIWGQEPGH
jgi:7-carboxy-7-deazaguanine synthase